jgi:4-oxalocrotonate tautomerase
MPIVQVSVWEGMSPENKKKTVEGITKVFEDLGVPKEAVEIVIYEAPKSNWATGGQLHSERHAHTRSLYAAPLHQPCSNLVLLPYGSCPTVLRTRRIAKRNDKSSSKEEGVIGTTSCSDLLAARAYDIIDSEITDRAWRSVFRTHCSNR